MPLAIALLRAVNVGGRNRVEMKRLRDICTGLACRKVQTLVQSGNVIFESSERSISKLAGRLEQAIEAEFSFRPRVILRSLPELQMAVANNPFASRNGIDPSKLLVTFLAAEPSPEARQKVLAMKTEPEELHLRGREIFMYFPNGLGRPKTSPAMVEKTIQVPGTGRNWNVVTKLLALAQQMDSAG